MNPLKQELNINNERYQIIVSVKEQYLDGILTVEEGNKILREKLGTCTPDEFAFAEQSLKGVYKDEEILDRMDDLLVLFDGVLVRAENTYPVNHPLWVYIEEINAMEKVLLEADELLKQENFIKNPWLGIFDSLNQWRRHLSRKQNQLYPVLEDHGFDRPTRIMWTFDDSVRDAISRSFGYLRDDQTEDFLATMPDTIDKIRDLYSKELEVLLPTAIRDEDGNFKGVLEMMQDCTHIRSLEGSRTLLTWDGDTFVGESSKTTDTAASEQTEETSNDTEQKGEFKITSSTTLSELIKHSPDIVDYLITINPKFEMLKSPMVKVMSKVASLKMISERGDLNLNTLIKDVDAFINKRK